MATKQYLAWIDRKAQELRRYLNLQLADVLDPFALAEVMGIPIIYPANIPCLPENVLIQLIAIDPSGWSAGTLCLPKSKKIIILNPMHADTRTRATLMEELAHIHLKHKPSQIIHLNKRLACRSYNKTNENQAYWVGAATLVTTFHLNQARRNLLGRENLAELCQVSIKLVKFRENVTGIKLG